MCYALLVAAPFFFHGGPRFYAWTLVGRRLLTQVDDGLIML
jgi:hypothetical protein